MQFKRYPYRPNVAPLKLLGDTPIRMEVPRLPILVLVVPLGVRSQVIPVNALTSDWAETWLIGY